jgi:hypothetical protein
MKNSLVIFCAVILVATLTLFAYNSDKGPARQTDGITELRQHPPDSILRRGKYLVEQMKYNEQDLHAIAAYLYNK